MSQAKATSYSASLNQSTIYTQHLSTRPTLHICSHSTTYATCHPWSCPNYIANMVWYSPMRLMLVMVNCQITLFEFSQYVVHNSLQLMFCNMLDGFLECNAYDQINIFVWCDYSTFKELVISDVAGLAQWPSDCGQTQLRGIPATSIAWLVL